MDSLAESIVDFIAKPDVDDFNSLALHLFTRQYELNLPYRRLCDGIGVTPKSIDSWNEIPAVPAKAFRRFDLSCVPLETCTTVFYSSGTTGAGASRHWLDEEALSIYGTSLRTGYANVFGAPGEIWALMPSSETMPHSSLSHMLGTLGAAVFAGENLIDFADTLRIRTRASRMAPLTIFGTAFGFAQMIEQSPEPIPLSPGSKLIETGGFKGRTRELSRDDLYSLLRNYFNLEDAACFSEYGMCEMGSQFYSNGVGGPLVGPHWVRTRLIDPTTGNDAVEGEPGLLCHFDLANYNSVLALQTQDRGIFTGGGFRLLGRADDADLRGCSLIAEELWA